MARVAALVVAALAVFSPAAARPVYEDDFLDNELFELAAAPTPMATSLLPSIVQHVIADKRFSKLVEFVTSAGLVEALSGKGPFTVFAPTDEAFGLLKEMPTPEDLKKILMYHVVPQVITSADARPGLNADFATLLEGVKLNVKEKEGKVVVGGNSVVTEADIMASNGVIHVIDKVLLPAKAADATTTGAKKTIAALAMETKDLSTLVSLAVKADLAATLGGEGPFTVFAPTNEAFSKLSSVPEGEDLKKVLLNHVVKGKVLSSELTNGQEIETLGGKKLHVKFDDGKVFIDNVQVVTPDVEASNGVVHILSGVLPAQGPK